MHSRAERYSERSSTVVEDGSFNSHFIRLELFLNNSVETRRESIEILFVESVGCKAESFAEALIVNNFSCAQELDCVADIRVINKAKNVVICRAGLLLCRHIFVKIGQNVAGRLDIRRRERSSVCVCRINGGGVVDKVAVKAALFDSSS